MNILSKVGVFTFIFTVCVTIDQATKRWAVEHLRLSGRQIYLDGFFQLIYAENPGAWGSLGATWPDFWRDALLLYLPTLVLLFLFAMIFIRPINAWYFTSFSFVLGGGVANLVDRIRVNYVVDMMWMGWPELGTNIFNFADVFIMTGLAIYLARSTYEYFQERKARKRQTA